MSDVALIRSTEVLNRSAVALIRDVPAHVVIEVPCHLIPGLRHSYDYMFQKLPILSLGHELCPPIELAEAKRSFSEVVRYGTFFTYFFLTLTPVNHLLGL